MGGSRFKPILVAEPPVDHAVGVASTCETGVDVVEELSRQHERVSLLLRCLDQGRWWSQSQPRLHVEDVHNQVAVIRGALDKIDVAVEAMRGL